jgi:putative zinc finger/helix-turn-helix YgiT family protein
MSGEIIQLRGSNLECPSCGSRDVRTSVEIERFPYGEGRDAVELDIEVPVRTCLSCGFQFTDAAADDAREFAIRRHLRLLTPAEIMDIRRACAASRKDFAAVTRIGDASLARWENGQLVQSGALDQLLYLLCFAENFERLRSRGAARPGTGLPRLRALDECDEDVRRAAGSFKLLVLRDPSERKTGS